MVTIRLCAKRRERRAGLSRMGTTSSREPAQSASKAWSLHWHWDGQNAWTDDDTVIITSQTRLKFWIIIIDGRPADERRRRLTNMLVGRRIARDWPITSSAVSLQKKLLLTAPTFFFSRFLFCFLFPFRLVKSQQVHLVFQIVVCCLLSS